MKLFLSMAFAWIITCQCKAQSDSTNNKSTDSDKKKSTLTLGIVYCANADYYGQSAKERLPYAALAASYRHKSGLYFTGLAYKLLSDTGRSIASAENLGVGMEFKITKNLSSDISYSHTFYPSLSPFLQAGNPDNASISLSYDTWVKPSISVDYAFGETTDIFSTAGVSKQITIGSISKKDAVSITPAFTVVAGTQHFYQTYITQKKLADSLLGIILPPLTGGQEPGSSNFTKTITTFNILSYNLKMPLDYSRANYMIEASCQFSMQSNNSEAAPGKLNSFISFSFYYQF